MTIKTSYRYFWIVILFLLAACSENVSTATPFVVTETKPPFFVTLTITSTLSPVALATSTPLPATETQQAWFATAKAIQSTANTATWQAQDNEEIQVAQFPVACENVDYEANDISPNGKWLSTRCGYKRDQTLVVQNKEGTKWVLDFKNFLTQEILQYGVPMGSLRPKYWSSDGEYLYFTSVIAYDGGGDDCFPGFGDYGLFRLNLKTGSWITLIQPTDSLLGYMIKFSSTGRRYVTNINGITITDLKTGLVTNINLADAVEGFIWSPDGTQLAFTVASCDEQQGNVQSSSVYVWDALKNEKRILFTTDEMVLRPEAWIDNSTFRVIGEKYIDRNTVYTIYNFDATANIIVFTRTATPYPR